jgi:hypothetical protein
VVVTDDWKAVLNRDGAISGFSQSSPEALLEYARLVWPSLAPYRVVRVALVYEGVSDAYTLPRVVVTDAMAMAALRSWSHNVNTSNCTAVEAMARAITVALAHADADAGGGE